MIFSVDGGWGKPLYCYPDGFCKENTFSISLLTGYVDQLSKLLGEGRDNNCFLYGCHRVCINVQGGFRNLLLIPFNVEREKALHNSLLAFEGILSYMLPNYLDFYQAEFSKELNYILRNVNELEKLEFSVGKNCINLYSYFIPSPTGESFFSKMLNTERLEKECRVKLTKLYRYLNGLNNIVDVSKIIGCETTQVAKCINMLLERKFVEPIPLSYLLFLNLYTILNETLKKLEATVGKKELMEIIAKHTKRILYEKRPFYLRFYYKKLEFHVPQIDNELLRQKLMREELRPQHIWETMRFTKLFTWKLLEKLEETHGINKLEILNGIVNDVNSKMDISEENLKTETRFLKYKNFTYRDPWRCTYKI